MITCPLSVSISVFIFVFLNLFLDLLQIRLILSSIFLILA
ncbi:hypothetical protein HMPREF3230_00954 [Gardnerella vaginalis]|uniref:Uncharacterized protein n=1 Tax=Gardnerella vaginalis TaxID=2702 RepID=A0A135Z4X8_GARVA|nr:hypothetical protein HMPREF3230_00954 [Gardnerella vaginalis]